MRQALAAQPSLAERMIEPAAGLVAAPLAAPRLNGDEAAGLDLILEGFLLHHGRPRHLDLPEEGRRVLAGDYCYAYGLVQVAGAGDLGIIAQLADLVALSASLVATGDRPALAPLWRTTIAAVAGTNGGLPERLDVAKRALRTTGDTGPLLALAGDLPPTPDLDGVFDA